MPEPINTVKKCMKHRNNRKMITMKEFADLVNTGSVSSYNRFSKRTLQELPQNSTDICFQIRSESIDLL